MHHQGQLASGIYSGVRTQCSAATAKKISQTLPGQVRKQGRHTLWLCIGTPGFSQTNFFPLLLTMRKKPSTSFMLCGFASRPKLDLPAHPPEASIQKLKAVHAKPPEEDNANAWAGTLCTRKTVRQSDTSLARGNRTVQ